MSGGIAYILMKTIRKWFVQYGNGSLRRIRRGRLEKLRRLIKNHSMYTNSPLAGRILEDWETNKTFHQSNAEGL
jgi:glutamate synthase (ferredoxin)